MTNKPSIQLDPRIVYEMAEKSLSYFAKIFFRDIVKYEDPSYARIFDDHLLNDNLLNAIMAFRGSSKTTYASFLLPLHQILFKKARNILILSADIRLAQSHLSKIKVALNNPGIISMFGDITANTHKYNREIIVFPDNRAIQAASLLGKLRGVSSDDLARPDLVILDDVESDDMGESTLDKVYHHIDSVILPGLDLSAKSKIRLIGTPVFPNSYIATLDMPGYDGKFKWDLIKIPVTDPDFKKSAWPAKFPMKDIIDLKNYYFKRGQEHIFYREYMLEIKYAEGGFWSDKDIMHYDSEKITTEKREFVVEYNDELVPISTYVAIDPAASMSKRAAYTAIVVIGISADYRIFVLETYRKRMPIDEQIKKVAKLAEKWDVEAIVVETVAYQIVLKTSLENYLDENDLFFKVLDYNPGKSKDEMYMDILIPKIKQHKLMLDREKNKELLDELRSIGKYKDLKDALCMCIARGTPYCSDSVKKSDGFKEEDPIVNGVTWITL